MGITDVLPAIDIPEDPKFGDYTTNVAMVTFGKLKIQNSMISGKNPRELAEKIKNAIIYSQTTSNAGILSDDFVGIERVEVAGPGFINMYVSEANLINQVERVLEEENAYGISLNAEVQPQKKAGENGKPKNGKKSAKIASKDGDLPHKNPREKDAVDYSARQNGTDQQVLSKKMMSEPGKKRVMVEFAHPNTHKAFHIGHLRNITTGECVVRLLESQGHEVIRANYQGDVGMHIAKALYALTTLTPYKDEVKTVSGIHERVEFLGKAYAAGSAAYEESDETKKTIALINKKIYARDMIIYPLYKETRQWSLDYFDGIYKRVYSHFDRLYFESETYESGKTNVLEGLEKGIFQESDGAVIFPGEKYGLHTRVFITKEGNPTYEGKDMGLAPLQHQEHHPDFIMHVLGPEQFSYTRVIFQALDLLFPEDAGKQYHLVYGWVKLKHGKMSSRLGNVVLGEWLLDEAKKAILEILDKNKSNYSESEQNDIAEKAAVAAVKYSFLKVGVSSEIAFDLEASVSFEGDSGPYLQYTYARAKSVLRKGAGDGAQGTGKIELNPEPSALNPDERLLARAITQFPDMVKEAAENFAPNTICTYLFQLAQNFNGFYANNPIVGNELRLALTKATAQVIKNGLYLLGIDVLEQM